MVNKTKITKATRCRILITSGWLLKYFANIAARYVCKLTTIQTPIENKMPRFESSFKLIFAAVILSKPGGITPTNARTKPKKKIKVISNVYLILNLIYVIGLFCSKY